MKSTTLLALVAAATMGYASPVPEQAAEAAQQGEQAEAGKSAAGMYPHSGGFSPQGAAPPGVAPQAFGDPSAGDLSGGGFPPPPMPYGGEPPYPPMPMHPPIPPPQPIVPPPLPYGSPPTPPPPLPYGGGGGPPYDPGVPPYDRERLSRSIILPWVIY